jgi:hypothetical protein
LSKSKITSTNSLFMTSGTLSASAGKSLEPGGKLGGALRTGRLQAGGAFVCRDNIYRTAMTTDQRNLTLHEDGRVSFRYKDNETNEKKDLPHGGHGASPALFAACPAQRLCENPLFRAHGRQPEAFNQTAQMVDPEIHFPKGTGLFSGDCV